MYFCKPEYKGLLAILWPDAHIFEDDLPFFLPEGRIVFYSKRPPRSEVDVIQVYKSTGTIALHEKKGFLDALEQEVGIDPGHKALFMALDETHFWPLVKTWTVTPLPKKMLMEQGNQGVVKLFRDLFRGFRPAYCWYKELGLPHQRVLLSLITMMNSTKNPDNPKYAHRYQKLLRENGRKMPTFKRALREYVESPQREVDFLSFLCTTTGV